MKYLAILRDSLRETLDRKSLYFLLVVSILLIFLCASTGFRELDAAGALEHVVKDFGTVMKFGAGRSLTYKYEVKIALSDVRETEGESARSATGYEFTLKPETVEEFHRAVWTWSAIDTGKLKKEGEPIEGIAADKVADPGADLEARFLRAKFREQMLGRVEVEPVEGSTAPRAFHVKLRTSSRALLEGAYEVSLLFGVWKGRLGMSLALFLSLVEIGMADQIGGFWGVMIAIIFTAGFVPGMLQKGTLDLLLAKPVRRPFVLLTKYVGGLFYAFIPAAFLIGGCWLAISVRSGYWNFGFLTSIGVLVVVFAILYSFTVLMGVMFRSTIGSILLTIGLWFFSFIIANGHAAMRLPEIAPKVPAALTKTLGVLKLGLPRTTEWGQISQIYTMKGNLGSDMDVVMESRQSQGVEPPAWGSLALSSAGFIAVMLGLACWLFARRDY